MKRNLEQDLDRLRQIRLSGSEVSLTSVQHRIRVRKNERAPAALIIGVMFLLMIVVSINLKVGTKKVAIEEGQMFITGLIPENSIYEGGNL